MARVTVEDCIDKIPNRYDLVLIAAQRARDISAGAHLCVDRDNDKNSVVALREIAENRVSIEDLQRSLVMGLQKYVETEEPEDEDDSLDLDSDTDFGFDDETDLGDDFDNEDDLD